MIPELWAAADAGDDLALHCLRDALEDAGSPDPWGEIILTAGICSHGYGDGSGDGSGYGYGYGDGYGDGSGYGYGYGDGSGDGSGYDYG